jgi:hypothetical protein
MTTLLVASGHPTSTAVADPMPKALVLALGDSLAVGVGAAIQIALATWACFAAYTLSIADLSVLPIFGSR